jgi:hypothetical protein
MYDFLFAEGTNPSEVSQNYLHIAAAPPPDVYDPEHDGVFLSESLGVHEHWNTTVDIFSSDRYKGIDYVAVGEEHATSGVFITKPILNHLYINDEKIKVSRFTSIIGKIDVEAQANILYGAIRKMQFYLDGRLEFTDDQAPFVWSWNKPVLIPFKHTIKVVAYYDNSTVYDTITVRKIL